MVLWQPRNAPSKTTFEGVFLGVNQEITDNLEKNNLWEEESTSGAITQTSVWDVE